MAVHPLTPEQIAELERLLEVVPSADWTKTPYEDHFGHGEMLVGTNGRGKYVCHVYTAVKATAWAATQKWQAGRAAHIELIAALRNAAPALLAEVKQAREGWQPIETAPKDEAESFLVLLPKNDVAPYVVVQVSMFEGRMYPDARDGCIDWEDGIENATHWRALPPPPEGE